MKSDLRSLVVAQKSYFTQHNAYAAGIGELKFARNDGDVVRLTVADNDGWAAEARSERVPHVACIVWINLEAQRQPRTGRAKLTPKEGEPLCDFDAGYP
jgi:hypothetical protein